MPQRISISLAKLLLKGLTWIFRNPTVVYIVHHIELSIPMSHALPRILMKHPDYSSNIGRIARAASRKYSDLTVIDIGANVGDTVAMIRRYVDVPMLCIDGDPEFYTFLSRNAKGWRDVETECAFVGESSGSVSGRIQSHAGTGHLVVDYATKTVVRTIPEIIVRHPAFRNTKLIKIDTDGFDTLIIRGALEFIKNVRPLIFFEYDPYFFEPHDFDGFRVFAELQTLGYTEALFFQNTGPLAVRASLADNEHLRQLHERCSHRSGSYYFDILVAHADDRDILSAVYAQEHA